MSFLVALFFFFFFVPLILSQPPTPQSQSQELGECGIDDEYCVPTDESLIPKGSREDGLPAFEAALEQCLDRHEVCEEFRARGECEINPGWMTVNCPVSCKSCHLLNPAIRCDRYCTPIFLYL